MVTYPVKSRLGLKVGLRWCLRPCRWPTSASVHRPATLSPSTSALFPQPALDIFLCRDERRLRYQAQATGLRPPGVRFSVSCAEADHVTWLTSRMQPRV